MTMVAIAMVGCGAAREQRPKASDDASDASGSMDAAIDAALEGAIDGGARDAAFDAPSMLCAAAPDGGTFSAPEEVDSGLTPLGIGTSPAGAVWSDVWGGVYLESDPPREIFYGPLQSDVFRASDGWFLIHYGMYYDPGSFAVGRVASGVVDQCAVGGPCLDGGSFQQPHTNDDVLDDVALDGSNVYAAWTFLDVSPVQHLVTAAPLHAMWDERVLLDPGEWTASAIAVDESRAYVFVLEDPETRKYAIRAVPKAGGSAVTLAQGVDPEPWNDGFTPTLLARHGVVAWAHSDGIAHAARFAEIVVPGANAARILVDEPDGIACGRDHRRAAVAMDDEYLYWATTTGLLKRVSLCGGIPEVLAEGESYPVAIAVDDHAVYWMDYGSSSWLTTEDGKGKVMRMRKLGAPGYADASTDAGIADASAGDADAGD